MESLLGDVRYAFRSLLKSPGFAVTTVLTLGLGIGANTAIFSLIHGVLLEPLPYQKGERLVVLQQSAPKADVENLAFSIKEVHDYRDSNQTLSGLALVTGLVVGLLPAFTNRLSLASSLRDGGHSGRGLWWCARPSTPWESPAS